MDEYHKTTEYFFRKELKWMVGFVYFFLALIITIILWANYFKIDIIVKARGVIRPDKTISNVINQYDGRLSEVKYSNGKLVHKEDLLYSVDTFAFKVVLEKNIEIVTRKKFELDNLNDFRNSIISKRSAFKDMNNRYYYQFQKYIFEKQRLESILKETEMEYFRNKDLGFDYISEMELERLKRKYGAVLSDFKMHKVNILSEIKEKSSLLEEDVVKINKEIEDLRKKIELGSVHSPIAGFVQCKKL